MSVHDWPRLASAPDDIKSHYSVIVVGSGYGGGIAASRLARAGQDVCLLERGREMVPGQYPDTPIKATPEMQLSTPEGHVGSRTGLFDFHVNDDINVLVGCGLGGTSLINANVALEAEPRVYDLDCWPTAMRADKEWLKRGADLARQMLGSNTFPADQELPAKTQAMRESAEAMGEKWYLLPINVTFRDGVNHAGVIQNACTMCGDCVSGCNYGAKNTTLMNYLPDAVNHGAQIFTEIAVRHVERRGDRWIVHCRRLHSGMEKFDASDFTLTADIVMLAAGTLGTTEILLRSRENGLQVSGQLGKNFTGNGDVLGFSYNAERVINGVGLGDRDPATHQPVGPCITSVIDMRNRPVLHDGMVLEEGSIPGAIAPLLPGIFTYAAATELRETGRKIENPDYLAREAASLAGGAYTGAVNRAQTYLVMTHDDCGGAMRLDGDRLRIDWPGVGEQTSIVNANDNLAKAAHANEAIYVRNPMWRTLFGDKLITVHPLGGAILADSAEKGVVNHEGKVFSGTSGTATYTGLYVCDGAALPTSVGVNPLLTISAVAERTCALLAAERGWTIDYSLATTGRRSAAAATTVGIEFTESMKGSLSRHSDGEESDFKFVLNVRIDDLYRALTDANHEGGMTGTVECPLLSSETITASEGIFNLFTVDPTDASARRMHYRMRLSTVEGAEYYFEGFKFVRNDRFGLDMWSDTSTLYITIHQGASLDGTEVAKGVLHIKPLDFAKQLTTMKVNNAPDVSTRLKAQADFGRFFAGQLFDVYAKARGAAS